MKRLLAVLALIYSPLSYSDDKKVIYKDKTEIDFEALELEGELVKPQGALVLERKKANFNPLIRLRKDFKIEISDSTKEIR